VDLYVDAVRNLTRTADENYAGGLFFITSCNFTEQELIARFHSAGAYNNLSD